VTQRYYDGLVFHRVVSDFMIQAGSPQGTGADGPGYVFADEFHASLRHDRTGVVSMANSGPHSNGGQFFVTVKETPWLDGAHTVFGRVVEGMQHVHEIARVATDGNDRPLTDVVITNVVIARNGAAAEAFSSRHAGLPAVEPLNLEMEWGAGTVAAVCSSTGRTDQVVYHSTNLAAWTAFASRYALEPDPSIRFEGAGGAFECFTGARASYPADTNALASPVGRRLTMTFPSDTFVSQPTTGGGGDFAVNGGSNDVVTVWQWDRTPLVAGHYVDSERYVPFYFSLYYDSPTNGRCRAYYYDQGWREIDAGAIGEFTDQPAGL
jgi:cyclophilin family peptidyl-prolyl cis-trans isomerase